MLNAEEMSLGGIHFGMKQPYSRLKEKKRKQGLGFQRRVGTGETWL